MLAKKRVTFTIEEGLIDELKQLSEQTLIPQARIVEQAIKKQIEEMKSDRQKWWSFLLPILIISPFIFLRLETSPSIIAIMNFVMAINANKRFLNYLYRAPIQDNLLTLFYDGQSTKSFYVCPTYSFRLCWWIPIRFACTLGTLRCLF